jgi:hypothetical protein
MSHPSRWIIALVLVLLGSAALDAGGWAVITVIRPPDTLVSGEPVTLTYAVRQHGQKLLNGLQGRIVARLGDVVIYTETRALPQDGHYAATLMLTRAGTWTVAIESGFHGSTGHVVLVATEPGSSVRALAPAVRGQRLFVSKGCARCHLESWSSAPRLSPQGYETGYLTRLLTSPPKPAGNEWGMPNLQLAGDEVTSLVAFINAARSSENAVVIEPPTCNVTHANVYGNALISTDLWPDGTIVFKPGGPGFVTADGALSMKWGWRRAVRGQLRIEGRRLDETAPPLRAEVPSGYGDIGFQSSALIFPTPGCWEVTGRVGTASLTFVTLVQRIGGGPSGRVPAAP